MPLFLFLLVSGVGCGFCLWPFLDFSIYLFRSFAGFENSAFLDDLNTENQNVQCSQTDSSMNFSTWNVLFLSVLNKHAPIKEKRVKRASKSTWLTEEITLAQKNRDFYHKKQDREIFKFWRNKAKKSHSHCQKSFFF